MAEIPEDKALHVPATIHEILRVFQLTIPLSPNAWPRHMIKQTRRSFLWQKRKRNTRGASESKRRKLMQKLRQEEVWIGLSTRLRMPYKFFNHTELEPSESNYDFFTSGGTMQVSQG